MKDVVNMADLFHWQIDFSFFNFRDVDSLEKTQTLFQAICTAEATIKRHLLLIQFCKGNILWFAREKSYNLGVPYSTERRYLTLYSLIKKYPHLLVCDLTFSQLIKHKNRLVERLSQFEYDDLNSSLGQPITIKAENWDISIEPFEEIVMPKEKMNYDCDSLFFDLHVKKPESEDAFDEYIRQTNTLPLTSSTPYQFATPMKNTTV